MTAPLWRQSAASLAKTIRDKKISSQDVIQAHLDRIEDVNHKVNAVTVVLAEQALRGAKEADDRIASGETVGPLHGVPITIKENIDLVGTATTHGVVSLKDSMPDADAPIVAHLKRAGAIPIGRTNLPDFGMRWHTDNDLHGATINPWDPGRTPGGSSGGEAAAIATGMSPLGVGNDMGGSLRYPAQCCGITAIKPSLGRVSRVTSTIWPTPPTYYSQIACVNGPLARTIEDLRLALDVMGQPDPSDPVWVQVQRLRGAVRSPVRVAVITNYSGVGTAPAVAAAVLRAAVVLADAGYAVEEVEPPGLSDADRAIDGIANSETLDDLAEMLAMMSDDGARFLKTVVVDAAPTLATYKDAIAERHRILQTWYRFFEHYSLILGPVSTLPAFEVGYDIAGPEEGQRLMHSLLLTETCNLLGLPSVAVPIHVTGGLPQGVQVIGPRFHEDLCLDAAEIIERQQGVFTPMEPVEQRQAE